MKIIAFLFTAFLVFTSVCSAQINLLREKIEQITLSKQADVGVAIYNFNTKDTLSFNGQKAFPMQSVYKFHLALKILNEVDKGRFTLDQKVKVTKDDLRPDTWSPLREKYPQGNVELPLSEILQYTVSQSDNNGCDILFRLTGGTREVNNYIHYLGIKDVAIVATEEEMSHDWDIQFNNWTTPLATIELLKMFGNRKVLSQTSYDFLWKTMAETTTGKMRLRGALPENTVVAHKTGTSGTNDGVTAATNDAGIIVLPNGSRLAICVLVSNSKEDEKTNEKIIADIAKAAWDYYSSL
ncbi:MAG TPA: class A beta-lactamase, subclass A2 [Bacteroidales bacterium]|nr:class A beta-lactamase, subclass A2 [Bacteroidales bacterium]